MRWLPDRVEYRVWRGGPGDESAATLIRAWTYTGPHIPRPEQPRLHLNLWKLDGTPAAAQEVVVRASPSCPSGASPASTTRSRPGCPRAPAGRLLRRRAESVQPAHDAALRPGPRRTRRRSTSSTWRAAACARSPAARLRGRRAPADWDGRDERGRPSPRACTWCGCAVVTSPRPSRQRWSGRTSPQRNSSRRTA